MSVLYTFGFYRKHFHDEPCDLPVKAVTGDKPITRDKDSKVDYEGEPSHHGVYI